MNNTVTKEKLDQYFDVTGRAIDMVKESPMDKKRITDAKDFLDMAERYYSDALHFYNSGEWVTAFAALNYAHGWLDAGARIRLFKVKDSKLFTVDDS
jgi:uncharacterized protein